MPPISEWQTLLAVQAGASATLTGLVFVAVSINLNKILVTPGLTGRAGETILQFLQVFFVSTAALIPRQSVIALSIEILAVSVLSWLLQVSWHIRYAALRTGHPKLWLVIRVIQTQLATIPFVVCATGLLLQWEPALYWLMPGFMLSFIAGVANAWVLLIEIVR